MNTSESEKRNFMCILRDYDDPLFDQGDQSAFSTDSSSLPEPTVVTEEDEERMVYDCCGCYEEEA